MKWPSWINLLIGVSMILWAIAHNVTGSVAAAHLATGSVVFVLSVFSIVAPPEFALGAWANVACGVGIALAPLVLGYWYLLRGLASMEVALGIIVAGLAAIRIGSAPVRAE
jgi:hypothetical protein